MESYRPESLPSNRLKAIQELTKGQILTNKLREMIGRPEKIESDLKSVNGIVVHILGVFDNTLSILTTTNPNGIPSSPTNDVSAPTIWDDQKSEDSNESIKTRAPIKTKRGCYKRRKNASTKTIITSTLSDDGYAWRKYGQKAILNSKHQRNYYRCSHKFEQGCQATKQVQKTNDEPPKYMITLYGFHTCNNLQRTPQIIEEDLNPKDKSVLINFESNTLVNTLVTNNKVDTYFKPMKHTPKEGFPSFGPFKQEQVSSSDHHIPCSSLVGYSQDPSEHMSMMSYGLDCEDMVSSGVFSSTSSTHGYDDLIEAHTHDLDDFLVELCP
ncbi:putative WRKY transcription factor 70 [Bidens hawaiensis]|uniref:putative WRKY transcription factor 70 n=1 Tax=Bidens hawaiensis TaxID=980011 RepID=UPI00404B4C0D